MEPWKTLERRIILEHGSSFRVESHTVQLPDGRVIPDWPWIIASDFVNVLAVTTAGEFLCFRQTKYGVDGTSLAPVGGRIEPGEDPLDTAKRELLEETGYEASKWIDLGNCRMSATYGLATAHFFLALDARCVTAPHSDDLEEQHLLHLSLSELKNALVEGQFKAVSWVAIVGLALQHLKA